MCKHLQYMNNTTIRPYNSLPACESSNNTNGTLPTRPKTRSPMCETTNSTNSTQTRLKNRSTVFGNIHNINENEQGVRKHQYKIIMY